MEKAQAKKERLIAAKGKTTKNSMPKLSNEKCLLAAKGKTKKAVKSEAKPRAKKQKPKPKMTPEELKAFRIELMAKARAAKKAKIVK
jgi:hypothetical protein